ncbi:MAG: hypothetical protein DMG07_02475 [Acidobacteria bacterium]|nr:MAG: hypothetical protein DMG07_02475 [Acidobacteriota bacterium]
MAPNRQSSVRPAADERATLDRVGLSPHPAAAGNGVVIEQGDVVWVVFPPTRGSGPAGRRPAVVLQHDRFNRTRLATTVVARWACG